VSAAHCFYYNGAWYDWANTWITFGIEGTSLMSAAALSQFDVTLPGGWSGTELDLDYALIEFWDNEPGCNAGWLGTAAPSTGVSLRMLAYPNDKPVGQLWRSSGSISSFSGGRARHNLDVVGGNAGAGLFKSSSNQVVGVQSRELTTVNEAVRWSSSVAAFYDSYSSFFPPVAGDCN
jgi:V8-like Glu-specific endopeptidase